MESSLLLLNKKGLLVVISFLLTTSLWARQYPFQNPELSSEERAKDLISRLTLEKKAALIFNMRYGFTIDWVNFQNYFYTGRKVFAKIVGPNFDSPGSFQFLSDREKSKFDNSLPTFQEKIVVLTDEYTQSQSEYAVPFFRQAQNCVVIGTNTAGANGDTPQTLLPGKFRLRFSAIEVLTPDSTQTQKNGPEPDIYARRTIEGIRNGKNEVLEHALNLLKIGK